MSAIDQLQELLEFRYACKAFDAEKALTPEEKQAMFNSLVLAPSSFGLQPWKFVVVETAETREKLREVSWGQGQVTDADLFVVFTVKTQIDETAVDEWMQRLATVRGVELDTLDGYKTVLMGFISAMSDEQKIDWAKKQAYIALGQLMTSAALLKLDTCPLEGIDPKAYDEILGLESQGLTTAVACAVGHRSAEDKYAEAPKVRFEEADLIQTV